MKRLKNMLLKMEPNTTTYTEMYTGRMVIPLPNYPDKTMVDTDPTYWSGEVGFRITPTHKLAQDKPTVTVIIPAERLADQENGGQTMKRLKHYLLQMEPNTNTYKEMYDAKTHVYDLSRQPWESGYERDESHPIYYRDALSFTVTHTHKLAQDCPTLTYHIPVERLGISTYTTAAADYCLRAFAPYIDILNTALYNRSRPDNENGKYYLYRPNGEVLARNTAYFAYCPMRDYDYGSGDTVYLKNDGIERPHKLCLCIRLQVQLPRRKLRKAIQMLCRDLPDAVDEFVARFDCNALEQAVALAEKQAAIRAWLKESDYCAFVANGAILPREKGSDAPMIGAIPFTSVPEDEIEVCGVRGMGIRRGVTVITGGGYSGKSTLLDAISAGIYDHVAGDGRELVITDESAVTISAEDGRSVRHVNIAPFIKWIPSGDPSDFSTAHASGSTSQAANIMEAVDSGAKLLLIDEDRSATNFMIRDKMMKALIEKEPITPFTDRVGELALEQRVSTILVIGGSGEYLSVADKVYLMDDFVIRDVTSQARAICAKNGVTTELPESADWRTDRRLFGQGFTSYPEGSGSEKLAVSDMGFIFIGDEKIDIRSLHDLVSSAQLTALGFMLRRLEIENADRVVELEAKIDALYQKIAEEGLDCIYSSYFTTCERFMDLPRKIDLKAVVNRMRKTKMEQGGG